MTINEAIVQVWKAHQGEVSPQSTVGGIIVPLQNVQIVSSLVEPTDAVNVTEGQAVYKGEVLAQLDTTDLKAQLQSDLGTAASDQAKITSTTLQSQLTITQNGNSVRAAQASLKQAQQTAATDSLNLQRDQQLIGNGYIAQQALDAQKTLVANDQQSVHSAEVNLQNIQSQVQTNGSTQSGLQGANIAAAKADMETALGQANQVRASIAKATIVSPVEGVVVNRNINPGEYPGSRRIFTLQQIDHVYAVLNGGGNQILGVRPGSPASIVSTDRATVHAVGQVTAVLDQITPGSTNFIVKVLLPNPRHEFRSGMVVAGVVHRPTTRGLIVPLTAFVDDTQSTVQTIVKAASSGGSGADETVVKTIPVTMIAEDGTNAVVTGVTPGQSIISNGQLGLADGQPVKPATSKNANPQKSVAEN